MRCAGVAAAVILVLFTVAAAWETLGGAQPVGSQRSFPCDNSAKPLPTTLQPLLDNSPSLLAAAIRKRPASLSVAPGSSSSSAGIVGPLWVTQVMLEYGHD